MPDLAMLFKFELSACTKEEVSKICQNLADSGYLLNFHHPLRRTAYDLGVAGIVHDLIMPVGYAEMSMDPDRITMLNVTVH